MIDIIKKAIVKGAKLYSNVSGGKDGQAMTKVLIDWGFEIEALVHADLGRAEWPESLKHCEKLSQWHKIPLTIVTRTDGRDLVEHWQDRMKKLAGTGKPFWSSSASRYCTSDLKRDPINVFYTSTGYDLIISCEGIRSQESSARAKKNPLTIRERNSSSFYKGMTVEEAIENFIPGKRLVLTWFPIFNFSTEEVWNTYGNTSEQLQQFRKEYLKTGLINMGYINDPTWNFHPAYVYGNERVSCAMCVLANESDIKIGAKHNPVLYDILVKMEIESGFTFRKDFSLQTLTKIKSNGNSYSAKIKEHGSRDCIRNRRSSQFN